jgi:hypothetical protein
METRVRLVAGAVSLFWLALGCGGADDGNGSLACGDAPCGGDLVGTWNHTSLCVDGTPYLASLPGASCVEASVGAIAFVPSGSFTLNADLTYELTFGISGTMTFNYPLSCFETASTCADLELQFQVGLPSGVAQSVSCLGTSTCACTFVRTPASISHSGTYTTSGSSLMLTQVDGQSDPLDYCVKGNTATFREPGPTRDVLGFIAQKS